jgi:hypothetical protein
MQFASIRLVAALEERTQNVGEEKIMLGFAQIFIVMNGDFLFCIILRLKHVYKKIVHFIPFFILCVSAK